MIRKLNNQKFYTKYGIFAEYEYDKIGKFYCISIYRGQSQQAAETANKLIKGFCITKEELEGKDILVFLEELVRELYLLYKRNRHWMRKASQIFDTTKGQLSKEQLWLVKKYDINWFKF